MRVPMTGFANGYRLTIKVKLNSVSVGTNEAPEYQLRLSRFDSAPVLIDTYMRDVDVAWSADSKYVAVTDWIGSNVADCLVVDTVGKQAPVSVMSTLPRLMKRLHDAHVYVSCTGWQTATRVRVKVFGHTDSGPSHDFDYRFVYDVLGKRSDAEPLP
jgi:hypothetical protein